MRTIKRYSNLKLYDTYARQRVTLHALAALIRHGEEIEVVDHKTGRDLTAVTLAQVIFEEEKRSPRVPVAVLREIILTGRIR
jgi:polyhydroxyalkanoate synthesis repressor PhaR